MPVDASAGADVRVGATEIADKGDLRGAEEPDTRPEQVLSESEVHFSMMPAPHAKAVAVGIAGTGGGAAGVGGLQCVWSPAGSPLMAERAPVLAFGASPVTPHGSDHSDASVPQTPLSDHRPAPTAPDATLHPGSRIPLHIGSVIQALLVLCVTTAIVATLATFHHAAVTKASEDGIHSSLHFVGGAVSAPFDALTPTVYAVGTRLIASDNLCNSNTVAADMRGISTEMLSVMDANPGMVKYMYMMYRLDRLRAGATAADDNSVWDIGECGCTPKYNETTNPDAYCYFTAPTSEVDTQVSATTGAEYPNVGANAEEVMEREEYDPNEEEFAQFAMSLDVRARAGRWGPLDVWEDPNLGTPQFYKTYNLPVTFSAGGVATTVVCADLSLSWMKAVLGGLGLPATEVVVIDGAYNQILATTYEIPLFDSGATPTPAAAAGAAAAEDAGAAAATTADATATVTATADGAGEAEEEEEEEGPSPTPWTSTETPSAKLNGVVRMLLRERLGGSWQNLTGDVVESAGDALVGATRLRLKGELDVVVVLVVDRDYYFADGERVRVIAIVLGVVGFVLTALGSTAVIQWITAPLQATGRDMGRAARLVLEKEDLGATRVSGIKEIAELQESFLTMAAHLIEYRSYMPQSLVCGDETVSEHEGSLMSGAARDTDSLTSTSGVRSHRSGRAHSVTAHVIATTRRDSNKFGGCGGVDVSRAPLVRRRHTVLAMNIVGFREICATRSDTDVASIHGVVTHTVVTQAKEHRGLTESFSGDRFFCSFNASKSNQQHRCAAARTALGVRHHLKVRENLRISAGLVLCTGAAGNMGSAAMKKFTFLSNDVTMCHALERFACVHGVETVLTHEKIADDIGTAFVVAEGPSVILPKFSHNPWNVYQIVSERESVQNEEWMYQLDQAQANNPYGLWNSFVVAVKAGDWVEAGRVSEAMDEEGAPPAAKDRVREMMMQAYEKQLYMPYLMRYL